ncbi:MAG: hypothetical protein M0P01_00995 [Treponema sp.]|nr:hypothetical protein [Treponema sp.]
MNRKSIYVYIAATLAMVVPAPGRFVCGIILVLELNFLMLVGTLIKSFIYHFKLQTIGNVLLLSVMIAATMFVRQILVLTIPLLAVQLGFVIYLPTVSSFLIGYMFGSEGLSLSKDISRNMLQCLFYSVYALIFFLFRDIAGFGTITLLTRHGIYEKVLFDSGKISALVFFATIPGALVCSAVILILHVYVINKITILENLEHIND